MSAALLDLSQRITQAHDAATGSLRDAVAHAVHAGELLTQAKSSMPHGSFGAFCAGLPFAETTARGYMRLARLDPANRQRVADLPLRAALLELAEPLPKPAATEPATTTESRRATKWIPEASHWHMCSVGDEAFHVVPALGYPGFFHISNFFTVPPDDSRWRGTWSAIPAISVDSLLRYFGLVDPGSAPWRKSANAGMSKPFGMPAHCDDYSLQEANE